VRGAREQTGNVGAGSGVVARSSLDLVPGKRTLTEGLQPRQSAGDREDRAAGPGRARPSLDEGGGVRHPVIDDVDTQCIGEDFARDLSDEALEQTIESLIVRRDRTDLAPTDREVAVENLAVLAAESTRRGRTSGALDRDAVRTLIRDATAGAQELAGVLQQLAGNRDGLRNHPLTERFLEHAVDRLTWVVDTANAGISYVELATSAGDQAGVALLGMAAVRAQAALVGLAILRPWCAFLQLHDRVAMLPLLQLEYRYRMLDREQRGVQAVLAQLVRLDPDELATAGAEIPGRVAALAMAFDEMIAEIERAEEVQRRVTQIQLAAEVLTFAVGLRGLFTMRGPPAAMSFPMPAIAGVSGGAATVGQVVVSAEWIAAIRHLIEIGAISVASAAEMLRTRGLSSAMAQATDLPQSVKDLLGEGPTTTAMKVTSTTGAGAARAPRHHVLPQEERAFFEQRGFTGDLDIDNFTVELEVADHQAQHGGGNWRDGRRWSGEWNQLVMGTLRRRERELGRPLTTAEIMRRVGLLMRRRDIPIRFVPYR
jgi:hypothetical protein